MATITKKTLRDKKDLFDKSKKRKQKILNLLTDAMDLTFPTNSNFYDVSPQSVSGKDNTHVLWDVTAQDASEKFSQRLVTAFFPPGANWAFPRALKTETNSEKGKTMIAKSAEGFEYLHRSNFQQIISLVTEDLTISTACVKLDIVDDERNPLVWYYVPLTEFHMMYKGNGEISCVFWERKEITYANLRSVYGDKLNSRPVSVPDDYTEFNIVEYMFNLGKDSKGKPNFQFGVAVDGFEETLYEATVPYQNFIVGRIKPGGCMGEYGNSVAIRKLSLLKTVNYLTRLLVLRQEKLINPPYIHRASNTQTEIIVRNGKVTQIGLNDQLDGLFPSGNGEEPMRVLEVYRASIKESFFVDLLTQTGIDTRYKSATEWIMRNEKFLEGITAFYGSAEKELISGIFKNMMIALMDAGIIRKEGAGDAHSWDVEYQNPVTARKKAIEIQKMMESSNTIQTIFGRDVLLSALDMASVLRAIIDSSGNGGLYFNDNDTIEKNLNQLAQARAQQAQAQGPPNQAPAEQETPVISDEELQNGPSQ